MFVTWEGRPRPFDAVLHNAASLPDLRVLSGIADELGRPIGFRTVAEARSEMEELGPWDGDRASLTAVEPVQAPGTRLAMWKQSLDNGRLQDGEPALRATARRAVARVPAALAEGLGADVTITGDRGSVTLPVEVLDDGDMAPDTVWVPANSFGRGVLADLASPGSTVTITGGTR
jgi:NADH-quinone oxidoreductase subunit G